MPKFLLLISFLLLLAYNPFAQNFETVHKKKKLKRFKQIEEIAIDDVEKLLKNYEHLFAFCEVDNIELLDSLNYKKLTFYLNIDTFGNLSLVKLNGIKDAFLIKKFKEATLNTSNFKIKYLNGKKTCYLVNIKYYLSNKANDYEVSYLRYTENNMTVFKELKSKAESVSSFLSFGGAFDFLQSKAKYLNTIGSIKIKAGLDFKQSFNIGLKVDWQLSELIRPYPFFVEAENDQTMTIFTGLSIGKRFNLKSNKKGLKRNINFEFSTNLFRHSATQLNESEIDCYCGMELHDVITAEYFKGHSFEYYIYYNVMMKNSDRPIDFEINRNYDDLYLSYFIGYRKINVDFDLINKSVLELGLMINLISFLQPKIKKRIVESSGTGNHYNPHNHQNFGAPGVCF